MSAVSHDLSTLIVSKKNSDDHGTQINFETPGCPSGLLQYANVVKPKTGEGIRKQIFAQTGNLKFSDQEMNNEIPSEIPKKPATPQ